ncbi:uncharacterized protein LODBEIA_P58150 [Lodderomyces beijingensis]|uniref:Dihydrofolate synthetase n=1 Tax=Lodderomyces beijingensis TaxID=1775926 RepID=A0ABP0ZTX2_9ASCO
MPIDLGLARITKLLSHFNNPHLKYKSIHIAGTNGKGSTLAYLSSILTQNAVRNGKFTSPHMIEINDCIAIDNKTYPRSKFGLVMDKVVEADQQLKLKCTEFEILTVAAFRIFELEKVEMALIEVGVGGRLDATNVLAPYDANSQTGVVATGITKIAMDHESLLGDTIQKIAGEKAGIMKPGVPCFVDASNEEHSVLEVLRDRAKHVECPLTIVSPDPHDLDMVKFSPLKGNHQIQNLALALRILGSLHSLHSYPPDEKTIVEGIKNTHWPGRLQSLEMARLEQVILDGAHNESAAIELGNYLKTQFPHQKITFVIGVTRGKDVDGILKHIVRAGDTVIPSLFSQPDRMPWIQCEQVDRIAETAAKYCRVETVSPDAYITDIRKHLQRQTTTKPGVVVICGSLYLAGDALRMVEGSKWASSN